MVTDINFKMFSKLISPKTMHSFIAFHAVNASTRNNNAEGLHMHEKNVHTKIYIQKNVSHLFIHYIIKIKNFNSISLFTKNFFLNYS